jgi:prolyl oligopeptidase PreP (S9A serine peptidase family)
VTEDPYLWLEDVEGEVALDRVREQRTSLERSFDEEGSV